MRRIRQSVEDSVIRSEWAAVFLHGGERTYRFWISSRRDFARSRELAGGNGKVSPPCKAAQPGGCKAPGSARPCERSGGPKPQKASHRHQGRDEETQRGRQAKKA